MLIKKKKCVLRSLKKFSYEGIDYLFFLVVNFGALRTTRLRLTLVSPVVVHLSDQAVPFCLVSLAVLKHRLRNNHQLSQPSHSIHAYRVLHHGEVLSFS